MGREPMGLARSSRPDPAEVGQAPAGAPGAEPTGAAAALAPLFDAFFPDGVPLPVRFWDGSRLGPASGPGTTLIRSPDALRRVLWTPGELGLGRAYVAGDLDLEGDIFAALAALERGVAGHRPDVRGLVAGIRAARRVGALGRPLAPPPQEARPRGALHSRSRDAEAIHHHYDVGNDFYRLVLGPSMTYSCARFAEASDTLEAAQVGKLDLVCRKLGLHERPGLRLLDVGCGWGSLAVHAAERHGAEVVGITISREQQALASERVAAAGLSDRVEIRLQDYRDLGQERFDAVSSIGMFEHVGSRRMGEYFATIRGLLEPRGRLLNHAISKVGDRRLAGRSFIGRYVFPDGELLDVGNVVLAMESAGFEVRDVESLREHYDATLRRWVANLEADWDRAVELVGEQRARVWRLYMAASAVGFADGGISVHQVLGVLPTPEGDSGMPRTRAGFS